MKKYIDYLTHLFGFEIKKYRRKSPPMSFLYNHNIEAVLDIGANVGQFASEIRKTLPDVRIYSFEPLKECFDLLNRTMGRDKRFKAYNFALGDRDEEVPMNKHAYTPSSSLRRMAVAHSEAFPHSISNVSETVTVKRLDEIAPNLDLTGNYVIKIDVQGFEDRVIAGGQKTLQKATIVIVETSFVELYEGQALFDNIYQELTTIGFGYHGSIGRKNHPITNAPLFEDSIFINRQI